MLDQWLTDEAETIVMEKTAEATLQELSIPELTALFKKQKTASVEKDAYYSAFEKTAGLGDFISVVGLNPKKHEMAKAISMFETEGGNRGKMTNRDIRRYVEKVRSVGKPKTAAAQEKPKPSSTSTPTKEKTADVSEIMVAVEAGRHMAKVATADEMEKTAGCGQKHVGGRKGTPLPVAIRAAVQTPRRIATKALAGAKVGRTKQASDFRDSVIKLASESRLRSYAVK